MSTLHIDTLTRLGDQFAHAVARLVSHRGDFTRAEHLVEHLSRHGVAAVAIPPSWPLITYAPQIFVNDIALAIPAINESGHIVINNQGKYQINPPACAGEFALSFPLAPRP